MYNGSDSVAHPLLLQKNYFYTAWNAAVLIAIDILLTVTFYFCLFVCPTEIQLISHWLQSFADESYLFVRLTALSLMKHALN